MSERGADVGTSVYSHPEYAAAYREYRYGQGLTDEHADRLAVSYVQLVMIRGPLRSWWHRLLR